MLPFDVVNGAPMRHTNCQQNSEKKSSMTGSRHERHIVGLWVVLAASPALAATYYVAPDGSDSAAGTLEAPWATVDYAQTVVTAGDTVYFRGGRYAFTTAVNT